MSKIDIRLLSKAQVEKDEYIETMLDEINKCDSLGSELCEELDIHLTTIILYRAYIAYLI